MDLRLFYFEPGTFGFHAQVAKHWATWNYNLITDSCGVGIKT